MNKYQVRGVVGEGAYGVVLRCRNKETKQLMAIKRFKESDDDESVRKTAVREVKILRMLRQSNIVHLHEAFRRQGKLYLVFEFMPKNLLQVLEEHPTGLDPELCRVYTYQLVQAIEWCHQHRVVHRDIKPENLLINPETQELKLCDFGFARLLPGAAGAAAARLDVGDPLTDYVATRWYRSPELLVGNPYQYEVDIWAVGCILGELLDGQALFPGESDADQLYVIAATMGQQLSQALREAFLRNDLYTGYSFPELTDDLIIEEPLNGLAQKYILMHAASTSVPVYLSG